MARVRIKIGQNEIEIDSRDFYADNDTIHAVINSMIACLPPEAHPAALPDMRRTEMSEAHPDRTFHNLSLRQEPKDRDSVAATFDGIQDAEAYEPEFADSLSGSHTHLQIRTALLTLIETDTFFDSPHTVPDIVWKLREGGLRTASLEVSKALAEMVACREILRITSEDSPTGTYVSPVTRGGLGRGRVYHSRRSNPSGR